MEQITIAGEIFNAPIRYEEGHELTAGEAGALNQTFHENLRNNFAKRVKDAKEAGSIDMIALQTEFDKYAEEYSFGVRTGGGVVRDPVMAEAMVIAKGRIRARIKAKGLKQTDVAASAVTDGAKKLIAKDPTIMELARKRVEEAQAAASADLDELVAELPKKSEAA
jgi:hypothetical protein